MPWQKVPPEHKAYLARLMAEYADAEPRAMFGCPVFFIGGNMCIGAFEDGFILRLSAADQEELLQRPGIVHFAPMDRPMREYLLVPPSVHADEAFFRAWIARAVAYTRTLPPPAPKKRKGK
jgi:hypothetical protein